MELTQEDLKMIREYNNDRNRRWWASMTPEERKQKRLQYQLTQARRKAEKAKGESA